MFLSKNTKNYKHIFMDESEALCLAFDDNIVSTTMSTVYKKYHGGNCKKVNCKETDMSHANRECCCEKWGELWFLVDINQASLFLPKHSPHVFKKPTIILSKVMRSTANIFNLFKQFYINPFPHMRQLTTMTIPNIILGHHITGPPVYWVNTGQRMPDEDNNKDVSMLTAVKVIIDLCGAKGFKPNDICVIPFLLHEKFHPNSMNRKIDHYFVENGYRPRAVGEIETFLTDKEVNDFLISWVLKVKGLEFKVIIVIISEDDYDVGHPEDRKRTYLVASRCSCLLIIVSSTNTKKEIDPCDTIQEYPFNLCF